MTRLLLDAKIPMVKQAFGVTADSAGNIKLAFAHALPVLPAFGLLALWFLSRPYYGIVHDARLYVGFALAELDPQGIGRDLMFAMDGQFGFTVFPVILSSAISAFGATGGAMLVTVLGLGAWWGAMAVLAQRLARGTTSLWLVMVFVAVLPATYGGFDLFRFGEALAVPRPFAEAGVLIGLALALSGRMAPALAFILASAAFHPIMALPGLAAWLLLVAFDLRRRRGVLLAAAACALLTTVLFLVAAAFGAPVAGRLFVAMDPAWRDILEARSPYLFPSNWSPGGWGRLLVQASTVVIAASLATGRVRILLAGVVLVAVTGVMAALLLGDFVTSLLVVQAQLWRTTWLLGVFAAASLAICSVGLWQAGPFARLSLAFLYLGWIGSDNLTLALAAFILSLALAFLPVRYGWTMQPKILRAALGFVAAYALVVVALRLYILAGLVASKPEDFSLTLSEWTFDLLRIPLCLAAVAWANTRTRHWPGAAAAASLLAFGMLAFWDSREPRQAIVDQATADPTLAGILASRPGEVLWLGGGFETWSWTGRPNWLASMQGASAVFSRPLAVAWDDRVRRLINLRLVGPAVRAPFLDHSGTSAASLEKDNLRRLCAAPDAPAWVIAPAESLDASRSPPDTHTLWQAPAPLRTVRREAGQFIWTQTATYAVVPCAERAGGAERIGQPRPFAAS